jgi:hypothetical protein
VAAERLEFPAPSAPSRQAERLIASIYHLIERGKARAYKRALAKAISRIAPLRAIESGPFPAYAFAPEVAP